MATQLKSPDRLRKEAAVVAIAQLLEAGDAAGEEATASNTVRLRVFGFVVVPTRWLNIARPSPSPLHPFRGRSARSSRS